MASLTTPVQGWPMPADADSPQVASDMRQLATALDVVPKRLSGLASARPLASATPVDTIYYATDTGVYSISTGAAWATMLAAGAWSALTLASGVSGLSGTSPSVRQEGDIVRFKGTIVNTSGSSIAAGTTLVSVPSALANTQTAAAPLIVVANEAGNAVLLSAAAGGVAFSLLNVALPSTGQVRLDGVTYTVS